MGPEQARDDEKSESMRTADLANGEGGGSEETVEEAIADAGGEPIAADEFEGPKSA
jgi:hypothetical protein